MATRCCPNISMTITNDIAFEIGPNEAVGDLKNPVFQYKSI